MKYWNNVLTTSAKWHRKHFISTTATYIFSPRPQGTVRNTEYIPDTSLKWLKQIFHQWRWTADIKAYKKKSVSLTIREMQSKCDTTTHLLECLKKKKKKSWHYQVLTKTQSNWSFYWWKCKMALPLGKSFAGLLYRQVYILIPFQVIYPRGVKLMCTEKLVHECL